MYNLIHLVSIQTFRKSWINKIVDNFYSITIDQIDFLRINEWKWNDLEVTGRQRGDTRKANNS